MLPSLITDVIEQIILLFSPVYLPIYTKYFDPELYAYLQKHEQSYVKAYIFVCFVQYAALGMSQTVDSNVLNYRKFYQNFRQKPILFTRIEYILNNNCNCFCFLLALTLYIFIVCYSLYKQIKEKVSTDADSSIVSTL